MNENNVIFHDNNSKEQRELINNKIIECMKNKSQKISQCYQSGNDSPTFIEIYAEVKPQKLIGGFIGYMKFGWLAIDKIWVDAVYRRKGIGKYLVTSAEQKAINNGIKRARVCTFDFQALPFYKKLDYTVYGKLEDYPEGHTLYYLKKNLV